MNLNSKMKYYLYLLLLFTIACTSNRENKKLNLVFILTDEQRFDTSAPYGNKEINTPNLNEFADEAVVFERAYVTQPVCSPSRASILTGLYPHTHGVTFNNIDLKEGVKTLPEMIHDKNYQTAYIGKWHLGNELQATHGFGTKISIEDMYNAGDTTRFSDYHDYLLSQGYKPDIKKYKSFSRDFASELPYEHSKSKFIENKAVDFIQQNKHNPFILYLGFLEPHSPINGPFNNVHDLENVQLNPAHFSSPDKDDPWRLRIKAAEDDVNPEMAKELIRKYWGLVHQVDLSVGRILQKLEEVGIRDNTIIVFTSEHGNLLGEHHMMSKTVMYEGSSRVPLFISVPEIKARKISEAVSQIDLVPTLLDLMNVDIPGYLQGKSLVPLMKGDRRQNDPVVLEWNKYTLWNSYALKKRTPEDAPCISELSPEECFEYFFRGEFRAIVKGKWKLNLSVNNMDKSQLFNLDKDPFELNNLFYSKGYKSKIKELKSVLKAWQKVTGDTVSI